MQEFRSQANLQKLQQKQAPASEEEEEEDGFENGVVRPREWSFARGMLYSVSLLTSVGKRIFHGIFPPIIISRPPQISGEFALLKVVSAKAVLVAAVICGLEKFQRSVRSPSFSSSHIRTIDPICIRICRLPSAPLFWLELPSSRFCGGKIPRGTTGLVKLHSRSLQTALFLILMGIVLILSGNMSMVGKFHSAWSSTQKRLVVQIVKIPITS